MFSSSTLILLAILGLTAYLTRHFILRTRDGAGVHHLPGPSSGIASWIWGHELLTFQHESTHMYSTWARTFGPLFKIKAALWHPDIIIASHHAVARHIFANTLTYVKSPAFRPPVANLIGKGLVWAEGEEHASMRRVLSAAFSQEAVKGMASDIFECAEKLESKLTNLVLSGSFSNGPGISLNIVEYTSACTLDIIGRVAFGHDFKATNNISETKDITSAPSDADLIRHSWTDHVNTGLTASAFLAPIVVRAIPAITRAPLPLMKTQGACKVVVRRLAGRLMEKAKEEQEAGGVVSKGVGRGKDILSILMRARAQAEKTGEGLTDEQILDNISTFTMVGHETTAGTLNFTLLELAQHPSVQTRLREEILAHGRDLGFDEIQKLEWLDAVVKEGLRLHPASPQTERIALEDDIIPLDKPVQGADGKMMHSLKVTKGQVFHIPFATMNTSASVWGPDANVFNPERWLKSGGVAAGGIPAPSELPHGWSGLATFCDGPRNCIGWRLAIFEFKVILATLIRSLEFHDTSAVVQSKISPTLQPVVDGKGGLLPLYITLA